MAEEIRADGESSWWQGDYKPNRTHTVTVIRLEWIRKEEGQGGHLSKHKFSWLVSGDCNELYTIWLLGIRRYWRGAHINSLEAGDSPSDFGTATSLQRRPVGMVGAPQGLTMFITSQTFSKLIVEAGVISNVHRSLNPGHRKNYPIRHRQNKKSRYSSQEQGCIKTLQIFATFQRHLNICKHKVKLIKESTFDENKRKWTEACQSVGVGSVQGWA